jgi:tryptophan-rich sensory protein
MTATTDARNDAPVWDRPNGLGLALSMIIPLVAVVAGNSAMLAVGSMENPDYAAVPWNPPGWLIGAIWCVIYPLWGAARWKTATAADPRSSRSWWPVALIVWGLCYPVVTAFVDTLGSAIANGFSLALALASTLMVWPVSRAAAYLIAPSIVWLIIANALGLQALQMAG